VEWVQPRRTGPRQGLRGRELPGMRQLHPGPQRHLPQVRHLRQHDRVQLTMDGSAAAGRPIAAPVGAVPWCRPVTGWPPTWMTAQVIPVGGRRFGCEGIGVEPSARKRGRRGGGPAPR
jgi:hypothetical protein